MKFILVIFVCIGQAIAQLPKSDSIHNKTFAVAEMGVSSYTASPVVGFMFQKEVTDKDYPLIILFRNGLLVTPGAIPNSTFIMQCGFGCTSANWDVGVLPFYFIAYLPKSNFRTPMALFAQYKKTDRVALRLEAAYFLGENKPGFQATLNYKLKHLKRI